MTMPSDSHEVVLRLTAGELEALERCAPVSGRWPLEASIASPP